MFNKIVLAGGSGFLGQVLSEYYKSKAKEIIILSRNPHASKENIYYDVWNGNTEGEWMNHLENCDLLVNLCGKNVNCRYTEKNRTEIFRSRLVPTALLGKVIPKLNNPPKVWINLSSATIYRHAEDRFQDEDTGETGTGFSVEVCQAWEKIFFEAKTPFTKKIALRTSMVLGRKDGVIPRLKNMTRLGMGGKQGSGNQYVSWIHEQDLARSTEWVYENGTDGEIYNCTAPDAVQNKDMMKLMRKTLGIPFGFSTPQWILELGAMIIGTETELVLKSRWVYPKRLLDKKFSFHFPKLEHALNNIFSCRV